MELRRFGKRERYVNRKTSQNLIDLIKVIIYTSLKVWVVIFGIVGER